MTVVYISQVTLSKEGSSGDYSLEAGALVLGDQGRFTGLSLRPGGRGFPPATQSMAPGYFRR